MQCSSTQQAAGALAAPTSTQQAAEAATAPASTAAPFLTARRWNQWRRLRERLRACASGNASGSSSRQRQYQRRRQRRRQPPAATPPASWRRPGGRPTGLPSVATSQCGGPRGYGRPCPQARGMTRTAWCVPRGVGHGGDEGRALNGVDAEEGRALGDWARALCRHAPLAQGGEWLVSQGQSTHSDSQRTSPSPSYYPAPARDCSSTETLNPTMPDSMRDCRHDPSHRHSYCRVPVVLRTHHQSTFLSARAEEKS